jgi:hypothetical protein
MNTFVLPGELMVLIIIVETDPDHHYLLCFFTYVIFSSSTISPHVFCSVGMTFYENGKNIKVRYSR